MGVINTLVKLLSSCVWLQEYFKRPVRACFQQPRGMLAEWQMEGRVELSLNLFCSTLKTQQNRYVLWLWISWDFKTLVLKPVYPLNTKGYSGLIKMCNYYVITISVTSSAYPIQRARARFFFNALSQICIKSNHLCHFSMWILRCEVSRAN